MQRGARIYVAGGRSMIGSAIVRRLEAEGLTPIAADEEPDYRNRDAVEAFLDKWRPEYVFVAAGETAGIAGNSARPADLMTDNLLAVANLIPAAAGHGVARLLYLASSCIYPKHAPHPLQTTSLWTGPVEPTSAAYATAKLAGVVLCDAFRRQHARPFVAAIGADAYGPGDDFSAENAHVVGALIRRFDEAARTGAPFVEVWGSGAPRREFIYVDDLADACVFVMKGYDGERGDQPGNGSRQFDRGACAGNRTGRRVPRGNPIRSQPAGRHAVQGTGFQRPPRPRMASVVDACPRAGRDLSLVFEDFRILGF